MLSRRRNIFLALALLATVVASVVDFAPPETVEVADRGLPVASRTSPTSAPTPTSISTSAPAQSTVTRSSSTSPSTPPAIPPASANEAPLRTERFAIPAGSQGNLFPVRGWLPPPPVAQAVAAPKAPPLPFKYLGKVLEDGGVVAFVSEGTRTHLLRKGDALPPYRVENVTPQEATLVYLPLNETQRLNFGSAN